MTPLHIGLASPRHMGVLLQPLLNPPLISVQAVTPHPLFSYFYTYECPGPWHSGHNPFSYLLLQGIQILAKRSAESPLTLCPIFQLSFFTLRTLINLCAIFLPYTLCSSQKVLSFLCFRHPPFMGSYISPSNKE